MSRLFKCDRCGIISKDSVDMYINVAFSTVWVKMPSIEGCKDYCTPCYEEGKKLIEKWSITTPTICEHRRGCPH